MTTSIVSSATGKTIFDLSREDIITAMRIGSTCWWEEHDGKWAFHYTEHEDVYDRIFPLNHRTALPKVYSRTLSKKEQAMIKKTEQPKFKEKK